MTVYNTLDKFLPTHRDGLCKKKKQINKFVDFKGFHYLERDFFFPGETSMLCPMNNNI